MSEFLNLLDTYARAVRWMRELQTDFQNGCNSVGSSIIEQAEEEVDSLTALHLQQPPTTPDRDPSAPTAKNGSGEMTSLVPSADVEARYKRLMRLVQRLIDLHAAPMSFRNPHYYEMRIEALDALRGFVVEQLPADQGADQGAEGGAL